MGYGMTMVARCDQVCAGISVDSPAPICKLMKILRLNKAWPEQQNGRLGIILR